MGRRVQESVLRVCGTCGAQGGPRTTSRQERRGSQVFWRVDPLQPAEGWVFANDKWLCAACARKRMEGT